MINLPDIVTKPLEKVAGLEDEFEILFKALAAAETSILAVPPAGMMKIHSSLLLHLIANLVELQGEVARLKGRVNQHLIKSEGDSNGNGTNAENSEA